MSDLISRQDAIEVLTETIAPPSVTLDTLVMRIDALPSAEAVQADGDLIRRGDAVALVNRAIRGTDNKEIREYLFDGLRKQMWELPSAELRKVTQESTQDLIPSAEARPTGEWIQKDMYADRFCSECNYAVWDSEAEEYNFCPNCGARMDKGGDSE